MSVAYTQAQQIEPVVKVSQDMDRQPPSILATKLYAPLPRPQRVQRERLIERLNESLPGPGGFARKLTLVSAPAGSGKTTLISDWAAQMPSGLRLAWLSLDEGDRDAARFLTYLIAAVGTVFPDSRFGEGMRTALQSLQPPPAEAALTGLLNEITALPDALLLVLDDYHAVDSRAVDQALAFLIEHLPPRVHLVIATREDPLLPLARLRGRGQLTELRAADLRFTPAEAADFLNQVMGLNLAAEDAAALETRTEGWIAGLQLAALALRGSASSSNPEETAGFIRSFTGSHRFVLDYLVEEVLQRQPAGVQAFLLRTSILNRLCGPLCEAVLQSAEPGGQATLEYLERANLFIVPLDGERRWYRYHHLFAELLRQRLAASAGKEETAGYHVRASQWFEEDGLHFEAFQHAAAANDIDRAERLIKSGRMPLHVQGAVTAIRDWLASLPKVVLDAHPLLWQRWAAMALVAGVATGVEEKLNAAEAALQNAGSAEQQRKLAGEIAAARSTLALTRYQVDEILAQSWIALANLPPEDRTFRITAFWTKAFAHFLQGDRSAARQAYTQALAISRETGDAFSIILALGGLAELQELDNQLHLAAETHREVLSLFGEPPHPNACEDYLGLARIAYEWNDLAAAEQYGRRALDLARQYDRVIDRFVICQAFLGKLKLAQGDPAGADAILSEAAEAARKNNFSLRLPEIAAAQAPVLIRQGKLEAAAALAQAYDLPLCRARVCIAQGDAASALEVLSAWREQVETRGWADERLKTLVLQAVAFSAQGEKEAALQVLNEALAAAQPEGFVRIFLDEGRPMADLLAEAASRGGMEGYAARLLKAFGSEPGGDDRAAILAQPLAKQMPEPLSPREMDVLRLIAQGLSNREIGQRLFLALDTVKGHNRVLFEKLQAQNRTEAVARARELGLLE